MTCAADVSLRDVLLSTPPSFLTHKNTLLLQLKEAGVDVSGVKTGVGR